MALPDDPTLHIASQSPKPTLLDVLQSYPVFDRLCLHLLIREIINLTRTCRALFNLYQTLLRLQKWDVDRSLRRFVKNPRQLRTNWLNATVWYQEALLYKFSKFSSACTGPIRTSAFPWKKALARCSWSSTSSVKKATGSKQSETPKTLIGSMP